MRIQFTSIFTLLLLVVLMLTSFTSVNGCATHDCHDSYDCMDIKGNPACFSGCCGHPRSETEHIEETEAQQE
eukprot:403373820